MKHKQIRAILPSLLCIILGLLLGWIILMCINPSHAWSDAFSKILAGGFNNVSFSRRNLGRAMAQTSALLCTGLSVAFAFKTGLFNIGVAGQYTVGTFGGLLFALVFHWPWYVCLIMAMLFGAILAAIPGLCKAYCNVNEVISAIMLNWIALYGVNETIKTGLSDAMYDGSKTYEVASSAPSSLIPDFGLRTLLSPSASIALFIAILLAIVVHVILQYTTFGYELKACGLNRDAAQYAGIRDKRSIVLSMMISGALAGAGGGLYYLAGAIEWNPNVSTALPSIGFNGIPVALLAVSNPIGIIFSALLIAHITIGGNCVLNKYFQPEITDIVIGLMIYFCAFVPLLKGLMERWWPASYSETSANQKMKGGEQKAKNEKRRMESEGGKG